MRLLGSDVDIRTISPLTLAFIGDAVYDLLVREMLVCEANRPVGILNEKKIKVVCCEFQSAAANKLLPILTEEEPQIHGKGRLMSPFFHGIGGETAALDDALL